MRLLLIPVVLLLSACGLGETAAQAELQARKAQQGQAQVEAIQQQIEQLNQHSQQRLQQALDQAR
jgi:hypothetical protein